ncbi:hypothetical protein CVT24_002795 [Panaeolus cyanescens]|uniref:Uncharacterized protein n=1 Tax=Panaeolus cyanescens TaxID=181874 RepID=A0A409X3R9_9AGAR|nr:hypothetical protein CVT24_002795 [Panaeolus cyanescens]
MQKKRTYLQKVNDELGAIREESKLGGLLFPSTSSSSYPCLTRGHTGTTLVERVEETGTNILGGTLKLVLGLFCECGKDSVDDTSTDLP